MNIVRHVWGNIVWVMIKTWGWADANYLRQCSPPWRTLGTLAQHHNCIITALYHATHAIYTRSLPPPLTCTHTPSLPHHLQLLALSLPSTPAHYRLILSISFFSTKIQQKYMALNTTLNVYDETVPMSTFLPTTYPDTNMLRRRCLLKNVAVSPWPISRCGSHHVPPPPPHLALSSLVSATSAIRHQNISSLDGRN